MEISSSPVNTYTIGKLARLAGVRPSTLRYYEAEGLLRPLSRTQAGYRLYAPDAVQVLQFIQRARRLGFSLDDIRTLLHTQAQGDLDDAGVLAVAEARFLALERQVTELLVMRHELEHFLRDLSRTHTHPNGASAVLFDHLLDRICPTPLEDLQVQETIHWLIERAGGDCPCSLAALADQSVLDALRGCHCHIWQEGQNYQILVVGHAPAVERALQELVRVEACCHAPLLAQNEEGYLLTVGGEDAFIFARLFLALGTEKGEAFGDKGPD